MKINKGTVFAVLGVVGTGVTAGLTARAVLKAEKVLLNNNTAIVYEEDGKRNVVTKKGDTLTKKEVVKLTWKCYILPTVSFVVTAAFILGSDISNRKKYGALMAAYMTLNQFHRDYEEQVKEVYGEEAHQNIVNAIMAQRAEDVQLYSTGIMSCDSLSFDCPDEEEHVFYLPCSDVFFKSTFRRVLEAEYHLNRNFVLRGWVTLSEFHEFLGIEPPLPMHQKQFGWGCVELDGMYWIDFNNTNKATKLPIPEWIDPKQEVYLIEMDYGPDYFEEDYV